VSDSGNQEERLRAARELLAAGRVLEVRVLNAGQVVAGVVAADGEPFARAGRHRVYIRRATAAARGADHGECSCGSSTCAHILAVSLAADAVDAGPTAAPAPASAAAQGRATYAQQLHYVLHAAARQEPWQLSLWVVQGPVPGSQPPQRFTPRSTSVTGEHPRYVDARDRAILQGLTAPGPWVPRGLTGGALLQSILATGRARLGEPDAPALRPGGPRTVPLAWHTDEEGMQELSCGGLMLIMQIEPPLYVDPSTGEAGPLADMDTLRLLAAHWPRRLAPEDVEALRLELTCDSQARGFPLPSPLAVRREVCHRLGGRLRLQAAPGTERLPEAQAALLYNGHPVPLPRLTPAIPAVRVLGGAGVVLEIERDLAREAALRAQLDAWLPRPPGSDRDWLRLIVEGVPSLVAQGWEVEVDAGFPYRLAQAGQWYADTRPEDGDDWFELTLGVQVDGHKVNLLPALTCYLEASLMQPDGSGQPQAELLWERTADACGTVGGSFLMRLADGRYLTIPLERIARIADTLVELFERTSLGKRDCLRLPRAQGTRLTQLTEALPGLALAADDPSLCLSPGELAQLTRPLPLPAPAGFPAQLRPYQECGLGWLQRLRQHALGGLLADDMGLGKTVQALAHIALERQARRLVRPVLIVAPVSALVTWQREIRHLLPDLSWVLWHGSRRRERRDSLDRTELILTGYPLLTLDADILGPREYSLVILDEAQAIKNPAAQVAAAACRLRSAQRLCLTGTPMENHLGELWSLFEFLQPGLLGAQSSFQRLYRTPIEKNASRARASGLAARVAPFLLRRTKENVATELPPKTQIIESIALEERQRDFYDSIRLAMHRRVREVIQRQGIIHSQITILDALLKLRQACCDPRLVSRGQAPDEQAGGAQEPAATEEPVPSAKLEWLAQALPQLVAEGRRILLFSQFTSMLALIEEQLTALELPCCVLTGSTRNRAAVVDRFQSGAVPLFLISLKAGGTALNLTRADTVIHYDPWWNPAVEAQATDRAHRIGQDHPVFVYKLIAAGTVEERILDLQASKRSLAMDLYGAHEGPGALSEPDLAALLAP
jgi:superfamily II DNA or RNA helicase